LKHEDGKKQSAAEFAAAYDLKNGSVFS